LEVNVFEMRQDVDELEFKLGDEVVIGESENNTGIVIGRADYKTSEPSYLVQRITKSGRPKSKWWPGDVLILV